MKEAIIYGGAFNPPTRAHQAILKACVEVALKREAEVWIMPSGTRTDKQITVDHETRLRLTDALCASIGSLAVLVRTELCELFANETTETYNTYRYLKQNYPDYNQTWVFGADSVNTMKGWGYGLELWNNLSMLVIPRPGVSVCELPPRATLLPIETPNVSSTQVREQLLSGKTVNELVPKEVASVLQSQM